MLRTLTWREWTLAGQVAVRLPLASTAVAILPLERASRVLEALPSERLGLSIATVVRLVEGVGHACRASCLTRALVLHTLLTRAGEPSTLVIGTQRDGETLRAHAWVEHDGRVLSREGAASYRELCRLQGSRVQRPAGPGGRRFTGSRE